MPSALPDIPYTLYLLECEDGSLYTGIARDVLDRFVRHALGMGAAYTRSHPPRRLLACRDYPSKGLALSAEYALKQLPRARKLAFFEAAERADGTAARLTPSLSGGAPPIQPAPPAPSPGPATRSARQSRGR